MVKALATFTEDWSFPAPTLNCSQPPVTLASRDPALSSGLPGHSPPCTHAHTQSNGVNLFCPEENYGMLHRFVYHPCAGAMHPLCIL